MRTRRQKVARIVHSNSHIDYVGRVLDRFEVNEPPSLADYGFGQFVNIPIEGQEIVGVIYNSLLLNPEYGNHGPRLSPSPDLAVFSPDFLAEQGVLIGILALGWHSDGKVHHGIPSYTIPVGAEVYRMEDDEWRHFHCDERGRVRLHYFVHIVAHARDFALPLIDRILGRLEPLCSEEERKRLCVLKKSLSWGQLFSRTRF
ncbi:MAG: hypothetical protein C4334_11125 [Pyrinomonas sp.]|uniref:hypothetical protein n=1 Tax=Pyrinomonas sp. TaxID=2080306 RepID=UPI0033304209